MSNEYGSTCQTCRYFDEHHIDPDVGFCRRHPPRLDDYSDQLVGSRGAWPIVEQGDWCGDWAPCDEYDLLRREQMQRGGQI